MPSFGPLQFPTVIVFPVPLFPGPSVAVASIHTPVFVVALGCVIILPVEALIGATLSVASFPSVVILIIVSTCDGLCVPPVVSVFLAFLHSLPLVVFFYMVISPSWLVGRFNSVL